MRVCLVGGIFGKDAAYRSHTLFTPETCLEMSLRELGHDVAVAPHGGLPDLRGFDIVHVHHFGRGAVRASCDPSGAKLVFTQHQSEQFTRLRRLGVWYTVWNADALVSLTDQLAAQEERLYPIPKYHCVIPNGVPAEHLRFADRSAPTSGYPWKILYAGQLTHRKGVGDLLQASAFVAKQTPIEIFLAYQQDMEELSLRALASQLGLGDRVRFLGRMPQTELFTLMASSHAVVLPSESEALPSVITEAMMTGTPVIASDVGGIRDQLNGFGLLVPPRQPFLLADALLTLFANYRAYSSQSTQMSAYARQRFSLQAMGASHENLYHSLLHNSIARRHQAAQQTVRAIARFAIPPALLRSDAFSG